jgi:hypothetical protein
MFAQAPPQLAASPALPRSHGSRRRAPCATAEVIDGKAVAETVRREVAARAAAVLARTGQARPVAFPCAAGSRAFAACCAQAPGLAVLLVGERKARRGPALRGSPFPPPSPFVSSRRSPAAAPGGHAGRHVRQAQPEAGAGQVRRGGSAGDAGARGARGAGGRQGRRARSAACVASQCSWSHAPCGGGRAALGRRGGACGAGAGERALQVEAGPGASP